MNDKRKSDKLKPLPVLRTDDEAERFVDEADLTDYDLTGFRPAHFEFDKKDARINMRVPEALVAALKDKAKERGIPYQRFIREVLEHAVKRR